MDKTRLLGCLLFLSPALPLAAQSPAVDVFSDLSVSSASGGAPELVLRLNRLHSAWHFMHALAARRTDSERTLGELFDGSEFNTEENRARLKSYRREFMKHAGRLTVLTAKAKDRDTLRRDVADLLNDPRRAEAFLDTLSAFEPAFECLLWKPRLEELKAKREKLAELARRTDLASLYGRAAAFYGSGFQEPVIVALSPLPEFQGDSQSPVVDNVVALEMTVSSESATEERLRGHLSVIFHETCHILLERQSPRLARKVRDVLDAEPRMDYRLFNEALATAMGAWLHEKTAGEPLKGGWYANKDISLMGKAVYPKVAEYLDRSKTMDEKLLRFVKTRHELLVQGRLPGMLGKEKERDLFEKAVARLKRMELRDKDRAKALAVNVLFDMSRNIAWQGDLEEETEPRDQHEWPGTRVVAAGNFTGCVEAAKAFKSLYDALEPPSESTLLYGTLRDDQGGHVVVEVEDAAGRPFLLDAAGFPALSPAMTLSEVSAPDGKTRQTGKEDVNVRASGSKFTLTRWQYGRLFQDGKRIGEPLAFKTLGEANAWLRDNASPEPSFAELEKRGLVLQEEDGKFKALDGRWLYVYQKTRTPFDGTDSQRSRSGHMALEAAVKWPDRPQQAPAAGQPPHDTSAKDGITVEALVDGDVRLHVNALGLYWENGACAKPGRHRDLDEPTFVNRTAWYPAWEDPAMDRGPDKSELFTLDVGESDLDFRLLNVSEERGQKGMDPRDPVLVRRSSDELILEIPDTQPGSKWYTLRLSRRPRP